MASKRETNINNRYEFFGKFDFADSTNDPDGVFPAAGKGAGFTVAHAGSTGVYRITFPGQTYRDLVYFNATKLNAGAAATAEDDVILQAYDADASGGATIDFRFYDQSGTAFDDAGDDVMTVMFHCVWTKSTSQE